MPFNVCDKNGKHLGFIYSVDIFQEDTDVVALSNKRIDQIHCKYKELLLQVAWLFEAKNLLGKVNEEKLNTKLRDYWQEHKEFLGDFDRDLVFKVVCLHKAFIRLMDYYIVYEEDIYGYLFFDRSKVQFYDKETIIIDEDFDYITNEKKVEGKIPIYARVIDYPIIITDEIGIPSSLGSTTQCHSTSLKLQSGNQQKNIRLPAMIMAKKGVAIELYVKEKKGITNVFCDGVIYSF